MLKITFTKVNSYIIVIFDESPINDDTFAIPLPNQFHNELGTIESALNMLANISEESIEYTINNHFEIATQKNTDENLMVLCNPSVYVYWFDNNWYSIWVDNGKITATLCNEPLL